MIRTELWCGPRVIFWKSPEKKPPKTCSQVGLSSEERADSMEEIPASSPSLAVGEFADGFCGTAVVGMYEGVIAQWTALAVFLPIVAERGGNAGMQTLTVIIRDMALGENQREGRRAIGKADIKIANGMAIGVVLGWLATCGRVIPLMGDLCRHVAQPGRREWRES